DTGARRPRSTRTAVTSDPCGSWTTARGTRSSRSPVPPPTGSSRLRTAASTGGRSTSGRPPPDGAGSAILKVSGTTGGRGVAGGNRERMRRGRVVTRPDTGVTEDTVFLQTPDTSFIHTDTWRSLRILSEFVDGFDALATAPPA